jgi:hypothetical protein
MKKSIVLGMAALFLVGIVAAGAYAFGMGSRGWQGNSTEGNVMQAALESGDYESYLAAFDGNDTAFMRHKLTEDEFNERVQRIKESEASHEAIEAAIESGDYTAWAAAIEAKGMKPAFANKITEGNFAKFVEMHEAMEKADSIAGELGIARGPMAGLGTGHSQGRGMRSRPVRTLAHSRIL